MNLGGVISCSLVLVFLARQTTCEETYDIPVAINALIQVSTQISPTAKIFYDMDKDFYSKVTVIDAALNSEQHVEETIQKAIKVVFLTVASSHVSKTLKQSDLRYKTKSKWSYTVDVQSILEASQGTLSSINENTVIYKIQQNAMKVLEERFQFQSSEILNRLNLGFMGYYAVDEAKWINVVGIIVEKVIANRSDALHLTSCYLAEMINKTVAQVKGFTLNEVDMYIYNTTMLLGKLPEYSNDVTTRLYQTFNMTPTDLARISNRNLAEINKMILHDVLKLFTKSVLQKLRVTENEITEKDSSFNPKMLLSCTDKWNPFLTITIAESFHNSAETMAIEIDTLSALIDSPYPDVQRLTIIEMIDLLEMTIDPLSTEKTLVEATMLSNVLTHHGSDKIDNKSDNVFYVIYRFTNFTERQLTILYGWTSDDYLFSSMFTLEEVNNVCKIDPLKYDLLALAKLTVGQMGDISCQSFNVLREIWKKKTLEYIQHQYSPGKQLPLDIAISMMVSQLTKAPSTINYRVLNITSEAEQLISKLSINNITAVSTYQSDYLKTLSFQDIIGILVHLKRNGSFDRQVVSHFILASLTPSLTSTPAQIYTTNDKFPTSTDQKSHTTTEVLNTSHDLDKHATVPISSKPFLLSPSNLLKLTSTDHMPQKTTIQTSNQINITIPQKRTGTDTKTRQLPSPTTTKYLNTESVPYSKIMPTLNFKNITSSYSSTILKHTLDESNMVNYSKSTIEQIHSTYHVLTYHVSSTTMSHPNSSSVGLHRNSNIETLKNISIAKSTVPITSSLSASYSSNVSNLANINRTTSKQHFIVYTSHSGMISSSKGLYNSKTAISQEDYETSISSTRAVGIMTEQTITASRNTDSNVTVVDRSKELKPSTVTNVRFSTTSKYLAGSKINTLTPRLNSSYKLSTNVSQTNAYSLPTSVHQSDQSETSLLPTVGNQSLSITYSKTQIHLLTNSSMNTDNKKTSLRTQSLLTTKTEFRVISLNPKPNLTTTTKDITFSVTPQNTISHTTSTKMMLNTTKSSLAMAGIDASSKEDFSSRSNNSSPHMISLVIQTTMFTSTQTSTSLVTSLLPTTTIVMGEKMSSRVSTNTEVSSMIEPSSTMNVSPTTTVSLITTRTSSAVKPSHTTSINVQHVKTSSPYLSTAASPTPPILSQPTKMSTTSLATSMTSLVKPSTTVSGASSSSTQKPGKVKIVKNDLLVQ